MLLFSLRYAGAELRRRWSRALLTAGGLGAGVSLVVAISGVSSGFNQASAQVLAPLGSVGTDILVSQTASDASKAAGKDAATNSLIAANTGVVTNLAALGKPGTRFTRDFFLLAELLPFDQRQAEQLSALPHVASATSALTVLASHQTGTVPTIVATLTAGGGTITQLHRPAPLTTKEAATVRSCILSDGGLNDLTSLASLNGSSSSSAGLPNQIEGCLPARFREYVQQVNVPLQTVKQVMSPPQTNIKAVPYTAAGIDPAHLSDGVVSPSQLVSGHFLSAGSPNDLLADAGYASTAKLHVGSKIPINGRVMTVVGLVNAGLGGQSANLYFPLATLQQLSGQAGHVNLIRVRAASAADVQRVSAEIKAAMPGAHLVTTSQLADQVKGSLATAKSLTHRFGGALSVIAIGAAFLITILLTLSSVAKRVREIGTLRAIGWSRRRLVGQLTLETLGIGVVGAVVGLVVGSLSASALTGLAPDFIAQGPKSSATNSLAKIVGSANAEVRSSMHIHIQAHVSASTLTTGALLALVGSLLAGVVAGWRAASLTPAVALRDIG
jgi:ABC-type antimicrobial peptide transport system permease subunit